MVELEKRLEELDIRDTKKLKSSKPPPMLKKLTKKQIELNAQAKESKKITDFFAGNKSRKKSLCPWRRMPTRSR